MPQFQLNADRYGSHPYYKLDSFAEGYVKAMFFTNGDLGCEDENKLNNMGVERLTRKSVATIKADCDAFLSHVMPDGCFVRQWLDRVADTYSDEQAGQDFWFTRQGHGVGFWCREELDADGIGDALSGAAKAAGEGYVETWRGWIHVT